MTIKYALTRAEIVRVFITGLAKSPRILMVFLVLSSFPALVWLSTTGAFSQRIKVGDVVVACIWLIIGSCLVLTIVFLRAKTEERTLSVSEGGISTQIGPIGGERPWTKVKEVKDAGSYILIVGTSGNSFFIPARAFSGADQRQEFLSNVRRWHRSA
jgi:hypothetical protein